MILLLLLSLSLLLAAPAAGEPLRSIFRDEAFLSGVDGALVLLYDGRFEAADERFETLVGPWPEHPVSALLPVLDEWWRILLDPDEKGRDEVFRAGLERSLELAERRLDRDPDDYDARFFLATGFAFRCRLAALRGEVLRAAFDGRRAFVLLRELAARHPTDVDLSFGLGLYDYFAATLPSRYPVLRPISSMFPDGDVDRGLARLERAAREGRFARGEAAYFELLIAFHFEDDAGRSRKVAVALHQAHPENGLFHTYLGRVLARFGWCREAEPILREVLARHEAGRESYTRTQAGYARLGLARCGLTLSDPTTTLAELRELETLDLPDFEPTLVLYRALAYDDLERPAVAASLYRRVLDLPDRGGTREVARRRLGELGRK